MEQPTESMSDAANITVCLDTGLKAKLEALAERTQRSKSWLVSEAITAYIEQESWQIQQIEETIQQADHSDAEWIAHEDVSAWLNTWGTEPDRLFRLAHIIAQAEDVFGDQTEVQRWLKQPNPALEGHTPLEMIKTEPGARQVEQLLNRTDHGIFA
jgi:RHH-type transcriptional regulator, rel operon repressor / antitoxin RelB